MLTLWDLLPRALRPRARPGPTAKKSMGRAPARRRRAGKRRPEREVDGGPSPSSMQARYDTVVTQMLARYGVRVRRWRTSMSGVAWTVTYRDGTVSRLIEAPRPRGPMSAAVFLHEIGHHALGVGFCKPRCLEEYHAWVFAIDQMRAHSLNVTPAVELRMRRSLEYAVRKALRRGIQTIPRQLEPYLPRRRG